MMSILKKMTNNERGDFLAYKYTGNAGRNGVKKNKTALRRATRRALKKMD
jgi:hypothetical protein